MPAAQAAARLSPLVVYHAPAAVCFQITGLRSNDWCELLARSVGLRPAWLTNGLGIIPAPAETNGAWFVAHRFTATGAVHQISFDTENWAADGAHFRLLNHGPLP